MMNVLKRDLKPLCALTSLRSLSRRTSCKYAKGPAALRLLTDGLRAHRRDTRLWPSSQWK